MPRLGRDLEKLVELIERRIHGNAEAIISSPAFLTDADTGERREHDIVIDFKHQHLQLRVAIECKDRKSKVGSPTIEGFWAKCQKTGVNSGIVVSSSGFSAPALKKAEHFNIRCLSLSEAEGFDWCLCTGIFLSEPKIIDGLVECIAAEQITCPYKIYTSDNVEFTSQAAGRLASMELQKLLPLGVAGGPYKQIIELGPQDGYVVGFDGKRQDILAMNLWLIYRVGQHFLPFNFHRYTDENSGDEISTTAITSFKIGNVHAQVMLLNREYKGIDVSITHSSNDD